MPRQPDLQRKPQLVAEILEYLLDKPLSSISFRTLASALGVSTYTLVYQFGTRAQLIEEVVAAVSTRASGIAQRLAVNPGTVDIYFGSLEVSWEWTLEPRNRQLQRLEFEAAMTEALHPELHRFTRELYTTWQRIGREALLSFGLSEWDAEVESRLIVDTFYGIQFDYVLNGDKRRATAAFERVMDAHRTRILSLMQEAA